MENGTVRKTGIKLLIKEYKNQFNIPENREHYSRNDYHKAQKGYVKYCLQDGRCLLK